MTNQVTTTEATDTPKIKRRPYLNTRPLIDEESLPFVGQIKRKAKNGKYRTQTHYWRVQKGAGAIDGLQYAVDFMDLIKSNQRKSQVTRLISRVPQDMGNPYLGDWWCKTEFLDLISCMLIFAAERCDYRRLAQQRLDELLQCEFHNPKIADCPDEVGTTKGGAQ